MKDSGVFTKYCVVKITKHDKMKGLKFFELNQKEEAKAYATEMSLQPMKKGEGINLIRANFDKRNNLLGLEWSVVDGPWMETFLQSLKEAEGA